MDSSDDSIVLAYKLLAYDIQQLSVLKSSYKPTFENF